MLSSDDAKALLRLIYDTERAAFWYIAFEEARTPENVANSAKLQEDANLLKRVYSASTGGRYEDDHHAIHRPREGVDYVRMQRST